MRSLAERLWAKVDRTDGCWIFYGASVPKGYGKIGLGGRGAGTIYAHRAAWIVTFGPIPDGMKVLHSCDNPPCCRPDHLFLGTIPTNNRDMAEKGRAWAFGSRPKLTKALVREARARFASGESRRAIARALGVRPQAISRIVARQSWTWLD